MVLLGVLRVIMHVKYLVYTRCSIGLPCGSDGKKSACNAGDPGSILRSGRFPGGGNGNPLQYSCWENPIDRGAWRATVHGVAKGQTRLRDFHNRFWFLSLLIPCPSRHCLHQCLWGCYLLNETPASSKVENISDALLSHWSTYHAIGMYIPQLTDN